MEIVWRGLKVEGSASYRIAKKIKALKEVIKRWMKKEEGKIAEGINNRSKEIDDNDRLEREGEISEFDMARKEGFMER